MTSEPINLNLSEEWLAQQIQEAKVFEEKFYAFFEDLKREHGVN